MQEFKVGDIIFLTDDVRWNAHNRRLRGVPITIVDPKTMKCKSHNWPCEFHVERRYARLQQRGKSIVEILNS